MSIPKHTISGTFDFTYGDFENKEKIFEELSSKFKEDYKLDLNFLEEGIVTLDNNEEKHFQKFCK